MRAIRVYPLFLIVLSILITIPSVHASTYIGYTSANQTGTCGGGANHCAAIEPGSQGFQGFGIAVQSPFAGKITSVNVIPGQTGALTDRINQLVILTFTVGSSPTTTNQICFFPQSGTCPFVSTGNSFTVQDVESISQGSLTNNVFNTLILSVQVSVQATQYVGVVFMDTQVAQDAQMWGCGASCPVAGSPDLEFNFGTQNPVIGNSYSSTGANQVGAGWMTGITFTATTSPGSSVSQCYGNCGSPAITLVNTNSTHTINFNSSITLFYEFQSNLNGIINNITTNLAKSYSNGQQVSLGLYTTSCNVGIAPFTSACPGQQQILQTFINPVKGRLSVAPSNLQVKNNMWIAIAISGLMSGLDINDTNNSVNLFNQNPSMPQILASGSLLSSSKMGLWTWITGNPSGAPSPIISISCGSDFICWELQSILGLTPNNPFLGAIFFAFIYSFISTLALGFVTVKTGVNFPGGVYLLTWVGWFTFFPALVGAIFFIILEILVVVLMFTLFFSQLAQGTYRHSGGRSDA